MVKLERLNFGGQEVPQRLHDQRHTKCVFIVDIDVILIFIVCLVIIIDVIVCVAALVRSNM